jgi:pantetheine-phosphate adenylyltransferase
MNRRAVFPGTFDPFTVGHASIVKRTLAFMDEVVIGVAVSESKHTFYNIEERTAMIHRYYADEPRITVVSYADLTADLALRCGAGFIVRGIRTVKDFEYEETMADVNRKLTGIETILLFTEPELTCVSSTMVRELLHFGKAVDRFIPQGLELPQRG